MTLISHLFSGFVPSFHYISKLCRWLLWKCCLQPLYLIISMLYKLLGSVFITVHFRWIKKISLSKRTMYTPTRQYMCVDLFCIRCLTFSLSLHLICFLSILLVYTLQDAFKFCAQQNWNLGADTDHHEISAIFHSQRAF